MLPFIVIPMVCPTLERKIWIRLSSIPIVLFRDLIHCLRNTSTCSTMTTILTLNSFLHLTKEVYLKPSTVVGLIGPFRVTRFQDLNFQAREEPMQRQLRLTLFRPGSMPMAA